MKPLLFSWLSSLERALFRFHHFGAGSIIKPFPRKINGSEYVSIGADCFFHEGLVLFVSVGPQGTRPNCTIGDRCNFGADAFISCTSSIKIGNDVLTSSRVYIGDSYHGYADITKPIKYQPMEGALPIAIGDGSFLGIGCAILPGVTLGKNCVVAANAVVTKSFPDYSVVAGVPAKVIKRYDPERAAWIAQHS